MSELSIKEEILKKEGFIYHFDREIYYNRPIKKIFTLEAIEDNSSGWLSNAISEENIANEWQFYFNEIPSEEIKNEILKELEG